MNAAVDFVERCILKVDECGDREGKPPGKFDDFADTKWFRLIYKKTEQWYRGRFGEAMKIGPSNSRLAVTLILDTPYLLDVPMTTVEPGTPGESVWLCFHDKVQANEDVLSWVQHGPVIPTLASKDVRSTQAATAEIASKLRAIHVGLMGLEGSDPKVGELREGILPNLGRAARHLAKGDQENIRSAHWDMQMACELALKCLAQQRAGKFKETHDLFHLYDTMPDAVPRFARSELSRLPNWERMVEFRYGSGEAVPVRQAFRSYRAALGIVEATTGEMKRRYRLHTAQFLVGRPPWKDDN